MREKMETYKYGPIVFIIQGMDESLGNFHWGGNPPVGYDEYNIPIDKNGNQCLDISCPIHPMYHPTAGTVVFNEALDTHIPTIDSFKTWFVDNFLEIDDTKAKKYILRWYSFQQRKSTKYYELQQSCSSVEEVIGRLWPDEPTS